MNDALKLADLTGVWRRESLSINGGKTFEDSYVYWLQAGEYFADMRWPISTCDNHARDNHVTDNHVTDKVAPKSAFAGKINWSAPQIQFDHRIDLSPDPAQDQGELAFAKGKLIEQGEIVVGDEKITFKEVWLPLPSRLELRPDRSQDTPTFSHVATLAFNDQGSAEKGLLICVDHFAIAMTNSHLEAGQFHAACWQRSSDDRQWHQLHCIGDGEYLFDILQTNLQGMTMPDWEQQL